MGLDLCHLEASHLLDLPAEKTEIGSGEQVVDTE